MDQAKRGIEPWQIAESTWLLRSGFMDVRRDRCRKPEGSRARDYFALDLKDFCAVVAVTPRLEVLLVREYKHGARAASCSKRRGTLPPRSCISERFSSFPICPIPEVTPFSRGTQGPRPLLIPTRTRRLKSRRCRSSPCSARP